MPALETIDAGCFSDLFKDANGFRPRGGIWDMVEAMSKDEFVAYQNRLQEDVRRQVDEENLRQILNAAKFEAQVSELMTCNRIDRATALRWIMQAEDCDDLGSLCYERDLPYGYFTKEV